MCLKLVSLNGSELKNRPQNLKPAARERKFEKVTSNEFMASGMIHKLMLARNFLIDAYLVYDAEDHWVRST